MLSFGYQNCRQKIMANVKKKSCFNKKKKHWTKTCCILRCISLSWTCLQPYQLNNEVCIVLKHVLPKLITYSDKLSKSKKWHLLSLSKYNKENNSDKGVNCCFSLFFSWIDKKTQNEPLISEYFLLQMTTFIVFFFHFPAEMGSHTSWLHTNKNIVSILISYTSQGNNVRVVSGIFVKL